jgi:hypothetical protein
MSLMHHEIFSHIFLKNVIYHKLFTMVLFLSSIIPKETKDYCLNSPNSIAKSAASNGGVSKQVMAGRETLLWKTHLGNPPSTDLECHQFPSTELECLSPWTDQPQPDPFFD